MKLKEFYEKPLKRVIEEMNLIDVKIYSDGDGEVQSVLLKYALPGAGKTLRSISDNEQIWS